MIKVLIFFGVSVAWYAWYFLSAIIGLMGTENANDPSEAQRQAGHTVRLIFFVAPLMLLVIYRLYYVFIKGIPVSSFIKNDLIYIIAPLLLLITIGFIQYGPAVFKLN